MDPNSSSDQARQSRGLARFWPGHGAAGSEPGHHESDEDDATVIESPPGSRESHSGSAQAAAAAHLAAQSQLDTQMVALGSRGNAFQPPRPWDDNQGGFPPVDSERAQQNGEAPRHGGAPIPNGSAPMPQPRPAFGTPPAFPGAPSSPYAPQAPQAPRPPQPGQSQPQQAQPHVPQQPGPQQPGPQQPGPQQPGPQQPGPQQPGPQQPQPLKPEPPAPQPPVAEAKVEEAPEKEDEREVRAIALGGATAARRRTHDEVEEAAEEPAQNGKVAGWATVPTSGIPSLAKQATPLPAARRSASLEDADALPRAGRRSPDAPTSGAPLKPGDVTISQIAFWDEEAITHFRSQWHEVKADFVDDPVAALTRAHDLLTEAVNELTEALLAERDELDPLDGKATPDTESMRMAMRGYREFLDRILAL
jgi:hypothetical protein